MLLDGLTVRHIDTEDELPHSSAQASAERYGSNKFVMLSGDALGPLEAALPQLRYRPEFDVGLDAFTKARKQADPVEGGLDFLVALETFVLGQQLWDTFRPEISRESGRLG